MIVLLIAATLLAAVLIDGHRTRRNADHNAERHEEAARVMADAANTARAVANKNAFDRLGSTR